jgi:hypothetical protein
MPVAGRGIRQGVGGRRKAGQTTFRVRLEMSFCSDLAGSPSSGHTDSRASSFKPRVRGSNPRAGTLNTKLELRPWICLPARSGPWTRRPGERVPRLVAALV